MEDIVNKWENGTEVAYVFDRQSRLNAGREPEAIDPTEFSYALNLLKRKGQTTQFSKRNGFTKFGSRFPNAGNELQWLREIILDGKVYTIGKGSADTTLYYSNGTTFFAVWSLLYNTGLLLTEQHCQILNMYNSCYIGNLIRTSALYEYSNYDLLDSRVILRKNNGDLETYPFGLATLPADRYRLASFDGSPDGDLEEGKYYFYGVTALYDDYMESNASIIKRVLIGTGHNTVELYYDDFPTTNNRIKKLKIYRSKGLNINEAPDEMYYITTINVNTGDSPFHRDKRGDNTLTEQISPSSLFLQLPAYRNRYWCMTNGRLIQANLQSDYRLYSAIPAQKITLALASGTGTAVANGVTAYYRISKVIAKFDGDKYVFIAGEPTLVSLQNASGVMKNIELDLVMTEAEYAVNFGDWNNYIMIERKDGATDYRFKHLVAIRDLRDGITDTLPVDSVETYNDLKIEVVKADGVRTSYDSPTAIIMSEVDEYEKFSENNGLVVLDRLSNNHITGIFDEQDRIIIFTDKNIYQIGTEPISPQFWITSKVIDGLGARGSKTSGGYTPYCCQGIVKLPNGSGYVFCNQTYKEKPSDEVVIYYWDGKSNTTTILSNEITTLLNPADNPNNPLPHYSIRDMTYDAKNNYIWLSLVTTVVDSFGVARYEGKFLIYDLENRQWYHWIRNSVLANSLSERYEQKILVGTNDGWMDYYDPTSWVDRTGTATYSNFPVGFNTKYFHYADALLTGVMLKLEYDTTDTASIVTITDHANNQYSDNYVYPKSGFISRIIHRANRTGNRSGFNTSISSSKDVIIKGLSVNIKKRNRRYG